MSPTRGNGRRSVAAAERRKLRWLAKGGLERADKVLAEKTSGLSLQCLFNFTNYSLAAITLSSLQYPYHLVGAPIDAKKVTQTIEDIFPGLIPSNLPSVSEEGRFFIPTPPIIRSLRPLHPPYLVGRFDKIVKEQVAKALIAAWKELVSLDVRFPKAESNRSKTPALHLGIWEQYGSTPRISLDSRQKDKVNEAMDKFLHIVHCSIAPKIFNILRSHYPQQFDRHMLWVSNVHIY
jgi:hypothetical protein